MEMKQNLFLFHNQMYTCGVQNVRINVTHMFLHKTSFTSIVSDISTLSFILNFEYSLDILDKIKL